MANYNVFIEQEGGPKTSPVCIVEYPENTTTGTGHTSGSPLDLEIGDTLTFALADTSIGPGGVTISGFSVFTDNSNIIISPTSGTLTKTVASGGTTANTLTFTKSSNNTTATDNFYVERQAAATLSAPTGLTTGTDPGTYTQTVTTAQTATGGTGGTMQVSENGTTWVTNGSSFTFTRGIGKPIYARTVGTGSNAGSTSSTSTFTVTYGYKTADLTVSVSRSPSGDLAHDYTGDVTVTISGGTANNRYRVLRTTGGNSGKGNTGILTGTSGTVVLHNADANDLPSAGNTVNYTIQGRVDTSKGGNDTYASTNASFSITRDQAPTTGSFDLSTSTVTEGGSFTVQNISTSPSGGYHLKLFRNSGDSPDSFSKTTETWTGTSTANFTVTVGDESASEIGYQGESFTWLLREGTDTSAGWNSGASLDSADITLYDNEHGTSISDSTINIGNTATSFTVGVISNWSGTNTVAARIRNTDTNTVVQTFNITTNSGTTNTSVSSGIPAQGATSNYRVEVYNGNEYLNGATFTVTKAAIVAPTISSVTDNNAANANVTTTVNLSNNGSGGTLKYAQTTSNSVPSSGWQTGNTFTHPRGATRYYWASQNENASGSFSGSVSHAVGYLSPDLGVAATNDSIAFNATSATTTVSGGQSAETYAVRVENGSTNLATRVGNGNITFSSSLPGVGNTTTYEIFARRPTTTGGDGSTFYQTNDTFDVSRAVETVTIPTDITFGSDPGTASATVSISATASGGSGGTLEVSADGSTWVSNGSSFTFTRDIEKTIYARRNGTGAISSTYSKAHTVEYLVGDTKVDLSPTTVTLAHDANSAVSITLTGGSANNDYQLRLGNANIDTLSLSGSSTSGTLTIGVGGHPAVNQSLSYVLYGRRTTASGGSGAYVYLGDTVTITRNSESVSAPDDITFGADPGTFSQTVSISATASGGSGGTLKVSDDGGNFDANGTSYTFTRGTPKTISARREGDGANSATFTKSHTVSKLATDTSITVSPTSTTVAPNANTSVTINISDATQQHTYSVFKQTGTNTYQSINVDTGTLSGTTGSVTIPNSQLPTPGNSITYKFYGNLPIASGGFGVDQATNGTFTISRTAEDVTPNDFSFTDFTNVARSTTQTSSTITVGGLSAGTSVAVSVTGGTYSKNYGSYTSSNGTASNGDTFSVRHTSSASFSTNTDTTLTIGNKDDTFRTTTLAADTVPDAFSFTDVTNAPLSGQQTSNEITIAGLNTSTTVSVTGGTYSKNQGTYTSSNGTASNGDTFSVRHTTSASYSTATDTELNIGGITDTWTTTTIAEGNTETGGGGGDSTGSGNYGIEVYGPDGETVIWGNNVRQTNMVVFDTITLSASSTQTYTCADANDSTKVLVNVAIPSYVAGPFYQTLYGNLVVTKSSTGFSVQNTNSSYSLFLQIVAVRIA